MLLINRHYHPPGSHSDKQDPRFVLSKMADYSQKVPVFVHTLKQTMVFIGVLLRLLLSHVLVNVHIFSLRADQVTTIKHIVFNLVTKQ